MPRMDADFEWGEVQASVPIHPKGDYQLTIKRLRGQAWEKKDKQGNGTGEITKVVKMVPEVVGYYGSDGKLGTNGPDKKEVAGKAGEEIALWVHSDGGRKQSKKVMMAIAGYNPNDPKDEEKFNAILKQSGLDLSVKLEEGDEGGYTLVIGDGWEKLFVGKNVRTHMEPETRQVEGKEPVEQQNYVRFSPVNLTVTAGKGK